MLFVFNDSGMDGMRVDGILGLSVNKKSKNFLDYAYDNG